MMLAGPHAGLSALVNFNCHLFDPFDRGNPHRSLLGGKDRRDGRRTRRTRLDERVVYLEGGSRSTERVERNRAPRHVIAPAILPLEWHVRTSHARLREQRGEYAGAS